MEQKQNALGILDANVRHLQVSPQFKLQLSRVLQNTNSGQKDTKQKKQQPVVLQCMISKFS